MSPLFIFVKFLCMVCIILITLTRLYSQKYNEVSQSQLKTHSIDEIYSLDQSLINGRRYTPPHPSTTGHPFLGDNSFSSGELVIRGIKYSNQKIKYDINKQSIVLEYVKITGGPDHIILNNEFIESFIIDNKKFIKIENDSTLLPGFYHCISAGNIQVLNYWKKDLVLNNGSNTSYYKYSDDIKIFFLRTNNITTRFRNNKSFYKLWPKKIANELRIFAKKNNIILKNAPDDKILKLLYKCNDLISQYVQ